MRCGVFCSLYLSSRTWGHFWDHGKLCVHRTAQCELSERAYWQRLPGCCPSGLWRSSPPMTHSWCLCWSHLPRELCGGAAGRVRVIQATSVGTRECRTRTLWRLHFGCVCRVSLWVAGDLGPKDGAETAKDFASFCFSRPLIRKVL